MSDHHEDVNCRCCQVWTEENAQLAAELEAARADRDTAMTNGFDALQEMKQERDAARRDCERLRSLAVEAISCLRMGGYTQMADGLILGLAAIVQEPASDPQPETARS